MLLRLIFFLKKYDYFYQRQVNEKKMIPVVLPCVYHVKLGIEGNCTAPVSQLRTSVCCVCQ